MNPPDRNTLIETMRRHKICVLVPTYNNGGTIRDVIAGILDFCVLYQKKDEIIFTLPGWLMVAPCMGSVNDSIVYGFRTVLTIPSTLTD